MRIAKLAAGTAVTTITSASTTGRERIYLLSADYVLIDNVLYEIKSGIPVWEYSVPPDTIMQMLPNGQMLYAFRERNATIACTVTLPDPKALEALKSQRPEDYLLAPGAQISLSGSLSMYGAQEKTAQDLVRKAVTAAGHKLTSGTSAYKLAFTSAQGPTEEMRYMESGYMGPPVSRKVSAPSTIITAALTKDGQTIWQQTWKHSAGAVLMRQGNQSMEQAAIESARPNAQALNSMTIPAYIPKGSTPGAPATLGASSITPEGFGPAPERKKDDKPDGNRPPGIRKGAPAMDEHSV